ncbi:MAG: sigma-54-dependent Fis family transcriptional regulator [Candidatus Eisenbacteria bacterium]|uniref:Sigma-54-dependent Fis family transcriptional regulator n=1 Tax=Eiseniibacteriota bacterium TaxID=2212470 RepID=A0A849SK92_UNCEI|nr:sigma-54-dependent Fis family transcriptional regulator [Candidatus Eisenbacteria bacterium]
MEPRWRPGTHAASLRAVTASEAKPARVLIADDDPDVLAALRLLLRGEGFEVFAVTSPAAVIEAVESADFDAALVDLNYARDTTSGREGIELVTRLRSHDPTLPVIVMTAWGSVEGAVAAVRGGARDYVQKPWDNGRLLATLRTQIELAQALRHGRRLEIENRLLRRDDAPPMIAESAAMQPVLDLIARVGPSDANVLVTGEHGTGKELVARILHTASPRAARAMVTINVGGLSEGVFESELFGHERGAFTGARAERVGRFELADGGTLFLDEIANVPLTQQAKLLRVLQTGEFERVGSSRTRRTSVRLVSATNADLRTEVEAGRFREDLRFRINTVEIHLPPLRDRRDDIPLLAASFLERHAQRYGKKLVGFETEAVRALLAHPWPGNVRELDHSIERAVLLARGDEVRVDELGLGPVPAGGPQALEQLTLDEVERELIRRALKRCDGNVSEAARALGLSRSALYRRLERHGL